MIGDVSEGVEVNRIEGSIVGEKVESEVGENEGAVVDPSTGLGEVLRMLVGAELVTKLLG